MKVPGYIKDMMERSRFALGYGDPGYTIEVPKATPYTRIGTLRKECERLRDWNLNS